MFDGLVLGWRTAVLLVAFVQLAAIAAVLLRPLRNRTANRTLAALLLVLAGMITPWMIGFAGFYDKWRWLSFAPFAISLAIAPLAYLYIHSLLWAGWPKRGGLHLVPALVQFAYLAGAFLLLTEPSKNSWADRSALAYDVIVGSGVVIGLGCYGYAGHTLIRRYQSLLGSQRSDDHRFALAWLERAVIGLFAFMFVWAAYGVWDLISPLGYRGLMGLYIAIAIFALILAVEGWRHASVAFPSFADLEPREAPSQEWQGRAAAWIERVRTERLFADPELSVPRLARILGTNGTYVSRAFNERLGMNFSTFINRLRSEDVAARICAGSTDDLLDLALESGFSSKASFNRSFQATFGCSPSQYRRQQGANPKKSASYGN